MALKVSMVSLGCSKNQIERGYNYSDIKFVIDNYYSVDNF